MPVCVPEDARRIMPDMLHDFTIDVLRKVPGSLEWQREQVREQSGIPLTEEHLDMLQRIATEINVPVPWES